MSGHTEVVGRVAELWRFPVKSFQGEPMHALEVAPTGVVGDRRYALREVATGKILSAKRHGGLLEAFAATTDDGVVMTLPDGTRHRPGDDDIDEVLSDWLGFPVELATAAVDASNGVYEFAFDIDDAPDAEWFDIDIPLGSFVDLAGAHLLTSASLAEIGAHHPDGDWDIRRFRPTALIDTLDATGYVEDAWVSRTITMGSVSVHVDTPTIRCVMPSRVQPALGTLPALPRDKTTSQTIGAVHGSNLGVYTSIVAAGRVAVGDEVVLGGP
ncbi:MAG: MOSC N-terminal beta barrel domain-containing protein [Actinobacteria bacterium]|nr:MOSC N-terminal beta barrel domain-containing protein [Actinomycetota bacterium]